MPDEDLRHSEREARANPSDREAGWRHARALERRGDRRGYLVALSRLARSGDPDAAGLVRDAVALAPVGPRRGRGRRCERLREPWHLRSSTVDGPFEGVLAATERVVYLNGADTLVAVDTVRLVELWRRPRTRAVPVALRGEDVVLGEGSDLVLLDGQTGRELRRERVRGPVTELVIDLDRAVVLTVANGGRLWLLVGIDMGEDFGRELWRRRHPSVPPEGQRTLHGISEGVVVIHLPLDGVRLEDGKADARCSELARRLEHDERRAPLGASCGGWVLTAGRDVEISETAHEEDTLHVISPEGRGRRVNVAASSGAFSRGRWVRSVSIAGSLGYAVSCPSLLMRRADDEHDLNLVNLLCVDLPTARVCLDVSVPVDLHGEFNHVDGLALEGAFLVVVTTPAGCTLLRFDGAVPP